MVQRFCKGSISPPKKQTLTIKKTPFLDLQLCERPYLSGAHMHYKTRSSDMAEFIKAVLVILFWLCCITGVSGWQWTSLWLFQYAPESYLLSLSLISSSRASWTLGFSIKVNDRFPWVSICTPFTCFVLESLLETGLHEEYILYCAYKWHMRMVLLDSVQHV